MKSCGQRWWIRYIFEHPNIPTVRPAENVGLQVRFLIDNAFHNNDCISLEDVESVYQDVVYNGLGEVKSNPIHTIIEEARPKVSLFSLYCDKTIMLHIFWKRIHIVLSQVSYKCSKFKASGLEGYLKLYLPPLTSRCPLQRSQQTLALLGATCNFFNIILKWII